VEKLKSESGVSPHVQWEQERFGSITNHILKARLESDEWHRYNSDQDRKVLRGGSWYNDTHYLHVANRYNYDPAGGNYAYGFRCVSGSP